LAQGLRIVRLVVDREKRGRQLPGVSLLAAELGMDQGRVSRLTQELCELGLLERADRGPFRTGPRFFGLAASLDAGWVRNARPELESLVAAFGLRARLSVRDGVRAVLLLASSNDAGPGSFVAPGMVTPVWCTGAGRALLLDHQRPDLDDLLGGVNFIGIGGPGAAHSVDGVWDLMVRDLPRGHITADEEFEHDIVELAVPVRDGSGTILAALSVLGRRAAVGSDTAGITAALRGAADRIVSVGATG